MCRPKIPKEPHVVTNHIPSAHEDLVKQAEWLFSSQRKEPEAQQMLIKFLSKESENK